MLSRICAITTASVLATLLALPGTAAATSAGMSYDFETGPSGQATSGKWTSGCFDAPGTRGGCLLTTDGALRSVPRGKGSAVQFPGSGSAVIQVPHAKDLNPGRADFTVSALVRLPDGKSKAGANVVQKGSYGSGQWKLQVDGGKPSCRIAGRADNDKSKSKIVSGSSLANGDWTSLRCVREGSTLSLFVDGEKAGSAANAGVTIASNEPVMIGGKQPRGQNDQFRGEMDDVKVSIG